MRTLEKFNYKKYMFKSLLRFNSKNMKHANKQQDK